MTTDDRKHDAVTDTTPAGGGIETIVASTMLGGLGALFPVGALRNAAGSLVRDPAPLVDEAVELPSRLADVALRGGGDDVAAARDPRFMDPAWRENPVFNRMAKAYLSLCDSATKVIDELDVDWRSRERIRQSTDNLLAAASPTNNPLLNPVVWKQTLDTGGANLVKGAKNFVDDMSTPSKLPASVDRDGFVLGETIATTEGKVVRREQLYELIEYVPLKEEVDAVPSLIIASPVNKFYLIDLDPRRSVVAAELRAGRRVFIVSWVNPDRSLADAGFDAYCAALVEAMETVCAISGSPKLNTMGLCGGGQVTLMTAAYLAAVGRQDIMATLTICIAVTDFAEGPAGSAHLSRARAKRAIEQARSQGSFDAAQTARGFALLRPVEGIWLAYVDRFLMGRDAPKHDLLFWANDQTNLTPKFGADMITVALDNSLAHPGEYVLNGAHLDVSKIDVPVYILGASTDHISPWHDCYRTVGEIGENACFVLASGGHAAAIAKGPGAKRASHRTGGVAYGVDPDDWLAGSELHAGPWWDHWNAWIESREPEKIPAPTSQGSEEFPPIGDAPGEYVMRVLT
ncbi:alpha/beta hydrolase [Tsukamurella sp. 1534]|uniref:PHA/PHB synthase family protein n=1 Tax=Tsukamurella sp. 1534 TaxID=1151061 RepID=UPI00030627DE|nr:alpha/beta fold hydrolase [Tsukamurella sp. 1534]